MCTAKKYMGEKRTATHTFEHGPQPYFPGQCSAATKIKLWMGDQRSIMGAWALGVGKCSILGLRTATLSLYQHVPVASGGDHTPAAQSSCARHLVERY